MNALTLSVDEMAFEETLKPGILHRRIQHRVGEVRQESHADAGIPQLFQCRRDVGPGLEPEIGLHQLIALVGGQLDLEHLAANISDSSVTCQKST